MFQSASVVISDPPFSFLLYETCKSPVKQMGFLLGEIIHKEITSITDNDQKQVYISKVIKINSGIPCPNRDLFPNGRVNKEKVGLL
ncbi:BRISC complex subunit FAM175B-like isoform X2 [Anthonomus grandis grandis]|uniref:BRISC complex subunit FAM175B-like isoform X2 n=1 Tax=Anthonomus grandis grandis TaxID=2921223 RepID=UPI002165A2C0|nr:BRISC complex subunit FAM175B-like isoform X2 [Anthonomus grandis grandis]